MESETGRHGAAGAEELATLRILARKFPTVDAAVVEMARLAGEITLPRPTVHIVSDVHGEDVKLRHIINNASGTLRPLVEQVFARRLRRDEIDELLRLIFYPQEMLEQLAPELGTLTAQARFARRSLRRIFEVIRVLARRATFERAVREFPEPYTHMFCELLYDRGPDASEPGGDGRVASQGTAGDNYVTAAIDRLAHEGKCVDVIRLAVRSLRDLSVDELIVAGDCPDRGPRADRVIDYLRRQPNVSFTWGNHDAGWIGACLGQEALVAHVLRISLRYRRLSQLEEGYGITLQPLEHLVRTAYGDDPAECFLPRGSGLRDTLTVARMQKAAAVMQFKLEGQTSRRNPEMQLEHRCLLHRIDHTAGTVEIEGHAYPLRDTHFPTIDPADPYVLSAEERACMDRLRDSFMRSRVLWEQMRFLVERGAMWLRRDDHLIFHGCVPVTDAGEFAAFEVDGQLRRGRALFDALQTVVVRALDGGQARDLDLVWYLWSGPCSPLFGKDRITTFERDLVRDPSTHVETKNAYFQLIHDPAFCERVLAEFGVDPEHGMIVNGHVPVKIDEGESPLKRSGKAITIDGAFSEAYGDRGYTLVMDASRTLLAEHHHFESVRAAVEKGVDIIPEVSVVRQYEVARCIGDTQRGAEIRAELALLERLVAAYRGNVLRQA
jgi:fructose-1,6-bisphosphatase-3